MFGAIRYFCRRFFAPRYWPKAAAAASPGPLCVARGVLWQGGGARGVLWVGGADRGHLCGP